MDENHDGVLITDGRNSVLLHPPRSQYPGGRADRQQIDVVAGPFSGSIEAIFANEELLRSFRDELSALHKNLQGKAHLLHVYENFYLSFKGDGLGHFEVEVEARAGRLQENRLAFSIWIDQTKLLPLIAAIDEKLIV